jgi:hypothetical protein
MTVPTFERVYGVDFSGAKRAGDATWVAEVVPRSRRPWLRLTYLRSLTRLSGTPERGPALRHLVGMIRASENALWAFDFPFGLPVELFPCGAAWAEQFSFLTGWGEDAYGCGLECVRRSVRLVRRKHILRVTDVEARTPFDSYHYRII